MTVSALGLSGCENSKEEWKQQAKELLSEKYGEEFEILSLGESYGNDGNKTYTVICAPEEDGTCRFEAKIEKDGSYFQDGYISTLISNDMEQRFSEKIRVYADSFYIHVAPGSKFVDSENTEMTLEEFLQENPKNRFAVYVAVNETAEEEKSKILEAVQEVLDMQKAISGSLDVSFLPEEKLDELQEYMSVRAVTDSGMIERIEAGRNETYKIETGKIQ